MASELLASKTKVLGGERLTSRRVRVYRLVDRGTGATHELGAPVVRIGAHQQNDLVLVHEGVSRIHCEITADEHGLRIRDLGSTNGTFVDDVRAHDVYLRPGAVIGIGRAHLVFEPQSKEAEVPHANEEQFGPLVGRSSAMRELFHLLARIAPTEATVLIQGESGTGKEGVAEAIHGASARKGGPLVVFDCAAVSSSLLESELFGYEKGAFTGAQATREGCLEAADGGTLFLDEIGELPLELQPKLLRAVERKQIRRVGGTTTHTVDVRIVAATNRDLAAEVNRGTFREDLYYRLAVVRVRVPPLRERIGDVPILVEHFVRLILRDEALVRAALAGLSDESWQRLAAQPWRGNVRELRNLVERRLALGERPGIDERSGPTAPSPAADEVETDAEAAPTPRIDGIRVAAEVDTRAPLIAQRDALLHSFEQAYVRALLAEHGGNFTRAAAAAGIDRMYFKRLAKKYGEA